MTGFNLPPGCSVSDLPGNTKAEQEAEAAYDAVYSELGGLGLVLDEESTEKLIIFIMRKQGEAFGLGYRQGMADEQDFRAQSTPEENNNG